MSKEENKNSMVVDLTSGSVTKQLLKFSYPFILSNLLMTLYTIVDMIVVGQFVGNTGLSAVSIGGDLTMFFMWIGMGLANAGQVIISQYVGRNEPDSIRRTIGTLFTSVLVLSVAITAINLLLLKTYLGWMNTPEEAWSEAVDYTMVCFAGMIFGYGYNVVSAILRGMGDSTRPLVFVGVATVLNIVLDIWFVGGLGLSAFGAALATVLSQAVSFIAAIIYLYIKREAFGFDFKLKSFTVDKAILKSLTKLGIPMALQSAAISISSMFVNSSINVYGLVASAVTGIGNKLNMITSIINNAMYAASASMIGQNLGAAKLDRVKKIVWINFALCAVSTAVIVAVFALFPREIFSIFNTDEAVLEWAPAYAKTLIVGFIAGACMCPFNALINGLGYASLSLVIGLLDGVVARIGLAVLLGQVLGLGIVGYWYGNAVAGFVTAILSGAYFFSGRWKTRKLIIES